MDISKSVLVSLIFFFSIKGNSQNVPIYTFNQLEKIIRTSNDSVYVINFWATWCKPCVKELPLFESLQKDFRGSVKVLLVNLDFKKDIESKLISFIKRNIKESKVVFLDAPDYNSWIDKVDSKWEGAIPATLVFNNHRNKRVFIDREVHADELNSIIKSFLLKQ